MKTEIINLLRENARISTAEMAQQLGVKEEKVVKTIKKLEADNVIKGYKVILNEEALSKKTVRALIEVKVTPQRGGGFERAAKRISRFPEVIDCYLISGDYDLGAGSGRRQSSGCRGVCIGKALNNQWSYFHGDIVFIEEI